MGFLVVDLLILRLRPRFLRELHALGPVLMGLFRTYV